MGYVGTLLSEKPCKAYTGHCHYKWTGKFRHLYWVDVHHKGAEYLDLDVTPFPPQEFRCLTNSEIGDVRFTLEGWISNFLLR